MTLLLAFFVATPYQLLCATQIRTQCFAGEHADLYLIEFHASLACYAQPMTRWFDHVYRTAEPMDCFGQQKTAVEQLWPFLRPRCDILRELEAGRYATVFSSRIGLGNAFYLHFIRKGNPAAAFHYYDEGVGNYCITPQVGGKAAGLRNLLGYPDPCARMAGYWLYRPELLQVHIASPLFTVPPIQAESVLWEAFPLSPETARELQGIDTLFFDAPLREQLGLRIETASLSRALARSAANKRVAIHLHPSQTETSLAREAAKLPVTRFKEPWEACLQATAVEDMTLIGIRSTALVTPKLLFDLEPRVILLWKLFAEQWPIPAVYQRFFNAVANTYRDPERFCIPGTWEELEALLTER
jgi:hypothetical protein